MQTDRELRHFVQLGAALVAGLVGGLCAALLAIGPACGVMG